MKEEKKSFESIFIGENTVQKMEVMRNLNSQIAKMQEFLPLLKDANVLPTYEILMDCLTIRKEERRIYEDGSEFGTLSYVFTHCEHIDNEFAKQIALLTENKPKVIADAIKAEVKRTEDTFKESVFKVFQSLGGLSKESTTEAEKYFIIEEGKITLPEDIEERVTKDTGVWCKTEEQAQAFEAHKQAADAINAFLAHFPKQYRPYTPAEVGNLFAFDEMGNVCAQTIDYSLYIEHD